MPLLSRSEEILLLAVWRLQEEAYGLAIRDEVSRATRRKWSIGAVYAPLQRLEQKRLLATRQGEPEARRGGRAKVYYRLTDTGRRALLDVKAVHERQWSGIAPLSLGLDSAR